MAVNQEYEAYTQCAGVGRPELEMPLCHVLYVGGVCLQGEPDLCSLLYYKKQKDGISRHIIQKELS